MLHTNSRGEEGIFYKVPGRMGVYTLKYLIISFPQTVSNYGSQKGCAVHRALRVSAMRLFAVVNPCSPKAEHARQGLQFARNVTASLTKPQSFASSLSSSPKSHILIFLCFPLVLLTKFTLAFSGAIWRVLVAHQLMPLFLGFFCIAAIEPRLLSVQDVSSPSHGTAATTRPLLALRFAFIPATTSRAELLQGALFGSPVRQFMDLHAAVESDEVSPQPPLLQAQQPQVPQPLPISLVLQTLPQLRCPSLDTLQPLHVSLGVRGPTLNTAFEVRPHQCPVQGHDHCPSPAGHTIPDTSQDAIGLLGHLGTLLAHVQAAVDQHAQVLFHQAAFQPLFPKPAALHGVAVAQVQDLALGLVEPHTIDLSPSTQPVQINTPTQRGVICKLTEGALDPFVQIIDEDIKQDWPQHRALGTPLVTGHQLESAESGKAKKSRLSSRSCVPPYLAGAVTTTVLFALHIKQRFSYITNEEFGTTRSSGDELVPPAAVLPFLAQRLCEVSRAVLGGWAAVTLTTDHNRRPRQQKR
ncbi:hypothetical protein QYF61_023078 [Mycteria americana]|uniref:Uncharacterized protein n=1 Tax=Mycteria americana TaxID=33587 RepID=A0AAN7NEZ6_MYCAM|nr:hypothetical protein QYF61_023078 [Mycteria americana]